MQPKKILRAGWKDLTSADYRVLINANWGLYDNMSDEEYLRHKYKATMGKTLNLDTPKTFNEKLQWLKLYNSKPEYTMMVDKYLVREYIAKTIGPEYLIPLLGVWKDPEDIDFDALPNQFVLKCNHNSGRGMCICRDKSQLDIKKVKSELKKGLNQNYFYSCREFPYKNVPPRILAEMYMQDGNTKHLPVYKIFNFGGEPKIIQVIQNDKTSDESIDYFDTDWNFLELRQNYPNSEVHMPKPALLCEMLQLARKLSKGFPFVRTDLYTINGAVYFSEYTFFSDAGFAKFTPENWDVILGSWIELPEKCGQ